MPPDRAWRRCEVHGPRWQKQAAEYAALLRSVIVQAARRVLLEEGVPVTEKIVSLFEPHTDIVRKGGRETAYGHKNNLATDRSGLVLDVVVETGYPTDSARCLPMLERHCEHYGKVPIHAAFDGGYASKKNLEQAKSLGVEVGISFLKRCFGLARCLRRGLHRFRAWVHSAVFAHNLVRLARLHPT